MAAPEGRLAENIVYFARALRAAGMPVGPGAVLDALAALNVARAGARDDFYWTLHAVFVKRHEHTILFDQAFRIFFRKRGYIDKLIASMLPQTLEPAAKSPAPAGGDSVAYCMQRFKSYDPASGTYLGYDGQRHPCP